MFLFNGRKLVLGLPWRVQANPSLAMFLFNGRKLVLGLPWRVQANPSLAMFYLMAESWFWVCPGGYRQIPASPCFQEKFFFSMTPL
jgi:hypothetical protein